MRKLSFGELCHLEPQLYVMLGSILAIKPGKNFCANQTWYGARTIPSLKHEMLQLVGWDRKDKHPVLSTSEAYNVAYKVLYEALPDCRNCICLAVDRALGF